MGMDSNSLGQLSRLGVALTMALSMALSDHSMATTSDSRRLNDRTRLTQFEQRRQDAAEALMVLRFSSGLSEGREARRLAELKLRSMDFSAESTERLLTALSGHYLESNPGGSQFPQVKTISTAEYDRSLAVAAKNLKLGPDFKNYLVDTFPALLEGRLKSSDAANPKFLGENIATLQALVLGNLRPNEIRFQDHERLLKKYIEQVSPQVWKNKIWRDSIRGTLLSGDTTSLERLNAAVNPFLGPYGESRAPYQSLVWGLGDVFKGIQKEVARDPFRAGQLLALENAFPQRGVREFARAALLPWDGVAGYRQSVADLVPIDPATVMQKIEDVDAVALDEFYEEIHQRLKSEKSAEIDIRTAKRIFNFVQARRQRGQIVMNDVELLSSILPKAVQLANSDDYFSVVAEIKRLRADVSSDPRLSEDKSRALLARLSGILGPAAQQPDIQRRALELLKSRDESEIAKGLSLVARTGAGIGDLNIQKQMVVVAKKASASAGQVAYLKELHSAFSATIDHHYPMSADFVAEIQINDSVRRELQAFVFDDPRFATDASCVSAFRRLAH